MNAVRRSTFIRIALLCQAILFCQIAHAAKPAKAIVAPNTPPSQVKLLVAQPRPTQKLAGAKKVSTPPEPSGQRTHFTSISFTLRNVTNDIQGQQHLQHSLRVQQNVSSEPQQKLYAIRI